MNPDKTHITNLFDAFNNLKVLIVGDVMLDNYLHGNVTRISPEAPVPIVDIDKKSIHLGGAANVALNTHALGAKTWIAAIVGNDQQGKQLNKRFKDAGIKTDALIYSEERKTTVKTRVIANNYQMLRIDEEDKHNLSKKETESLLTAVSNLIDNIKPDLIIFEDYDKGVLHPDVIERIISKAQENNIVTAVDPKKNNFWAYQKVDLFKPNLKELKEGLGYSINPENKEEIKQALIDMAEKLNNQHGLLTLSAHGMVLNYKSTFEFLPAHKRDISDVSGAGDTVIAVAACCLALQVPPKLLVQLANLAGGLVCEKIGVVPVNKAILLREALEIL